MMDVWKVAVLKCIDSLGGRASFQRICENIGNFK